MERERATQHEEEWGQISEADEPRHLVKRAPLYLPYLNLFQFKKDKKPQNITDRILGRDGKPRLITRQQLETMPLTSRQGWEVRVRRWWEEMDEELKSDEVDIRKAKWGRKLKEYARNNYPKDGEKILYGGL